MGVTTQSKGNGIALSQQPPKKHMSAMARNEAATKPAETTSEATPKHVGQAQLGKHTKVMVTKTENAETTDTDSTVNSTDTATALTLKQTRKCAAEE